MLGRNNDLYSTGTSAEDQMKINAVRHESQEVYEHNLYKEAARRVVFANCFDSCELDAKTIPNFNRAFYYGQPGAQACLQDCYNTRMKLHFGSTAEKEGMQMNFGEMKQEYQRYENWHPLTRLYKEKTQANGNDFVQTMTSSLLEKSKKETRGKFDFN
jgi:hypothetical protein